MVLSASLAAAVLSIRSMGLSLVAGIKLMLASFQATGEILPLTNSTIVARSGCFC